MILDETGKWDAMVSNYALSFVERLAKTLEGSATIVSYETTKEGALIWHGYAESNGFKNRHNFEIHNEPEDGGW